jgi:hypothetical protein
MHVSMNIKLKNVSILYGYMFKVVDLTAFTVNMYCSSTITFLPAVLL